MNTIYTQHYCDGCVLTFFLESTGDAVIKPYCPKCGKNSAVEFVDMSVPNDKMYGLYYMKEMYEQSEKRREFLEAENEKIENEIRGLRKENNVWKEVVRQLQERKITIFHGRVN